MKVNFKVSDKLIFEVDGENQRGLFEQLANIQEIFSYSKCGKCGCSDVRFVVREVKDNKFYEMHCQDPKCRARLAFGCNKNGKTLFPKRKDADDKYLPNSGWVKWEGDKEDKS